MKFYTKTNELKARIETIEAEKARLDEEVKRLRQEIADEAREASEYHLVQRKRPISHEDGILTFRFSGAGRGWGLYTFCPCCNIISFCKMERLGVRLIRIQHPRKHGETTFHCVEATYQGNGVYHRVAPCDGKESQVLASSGELPVIPGVLEWELYD